MEGSQPLCLDPVLYAAAIIISREDPSRDSAIRDAPRLPRARHQAATGARPRGLYDLDDDLGDHDDLGPRGALTRRRHRLSPWLSDRPSGL